ncbi:MAG: hypothetical protein JJ927_12105 [Balneola sp.]|nr:hypothetical protein [Balneola sp.]MBO6651766.1 hypothetical protein [Balneola sp.]MBO6711113.1 hypothetical protein [Balneola sp.]
MITGFVLSCSTGPEFERDNENDPGSNSFLPDSPEQSGANIYINSARDVILSWADSSSFIDGYMVKKKYSNSDEFLVIDTLDSNQFQYVDRSPMISSETHYQVVSYSIRNGAINQSDNPLVFDLTFEPVSDLNLIISNNNEATLTWSFSNRDTIGTKYFDAFIVEINKSSINQNWEVLDTLRRSDFSSNSASFSVPSDLFQINLRISQKPLIDDINPLFLSTKNFKKDYKFPTSVTSSLINEIEFNLTWQNPISDFDKILIFNNSEVIDTVVGTVNTHTFSFKGNNRTYRSFGVQLVKNENYSKLVYVNGPGIPVFVEEPEIQRVESISESDLKLFWKSYSGNSNGIEKSFIIERNDSFNSFFSIIDTVNGNQFSYTDTNVDKSLSYSYRIRSILSNPSNQVDISYEKTLKVNTISEFEYPGWYHEFSESGNLRGRYNSEDLDIYIFNDFLSNYERIKIESNIPNYARSSALSEYELGKNDSLIAYVFAEDYLEGRYILNVYNHKTNKIIHSLGGQIATSLKDLHFTSNNKELVFVSVQNENIINILDLENFQLKSFTIQHDFNQSYTNKMILYTDELSFLCSESGIYSFNLTEGTESLENSSSCMNMFKDDRTGVLYFYSNTNSEVYSFNPLTSDINLIASLSSSINIEPYDFKHIPELDIIFYNRARVNGETPQFSTSLIQDLSNDSYLFFTHQQIDENRGAVPDYITFDEVSQEIIMYTYNGIYNYSLIEGWTKIN